MGIAVAVIITTSRCQQHEEYACAVLATAYSPNKLYTMQPVYCCRGMSALGVVPCDRPRHWLRCLQRLEMCIRGEPLSRLLVLATQSMT